MELHKIRKHNEYLLLNGKTILAQMKYENIIKNMYY